MECDRQGSLRSKPIRGLRHSPAGEGGSLTVSTAHGPPHSASGRRLGSRLFIIKPVKNTSQTASELQTDGRCVLFACVGFLSGSQPSQPGSQLCWLPAAGWGQSSILSRAQPKFCAATCSSLRSLWGPHSRSRLRAQPCPVHRKTERALPWANSARPPAQVVDDRFAGLGKHRRHGVRRGIRFLG